MQTSITITDGIVKGLSYRFRYRVLNANGWSEYSDITYIKAAVVPGKPEPPLLISATNTEM